TAGVEVPRAGLTSQYAERSSAGTTSGVTRRRRPSGPQRGVTGPRRRLADYRWGNALVCTPRAGLPASAPARAAAVSALRRPGKRGDVRSAGDRRAGERMNSGTEIPTGSGVTLRSYPAVFVRWRVFGRGRPSMDRSRMRG